MSSDITKAAALLRQHNNILILTHRRPDGDTAGCAAGLCAMLRQIGKTAYVLYNPDITASNRGYLEPYWAPAGYAPEFVVSVDIASRSLFFPAAEEYFDRIGLAVDHHPSFEGFGAAQCVDASCAACGEIVYAICRELGEITPEAALPLYAAVSTDTGCFVYANTTANTHRVAAALLETGIDYFAVNAAGSVPPENAGVTMPRRTTGSPASLHSWVPDTWSQPFWETPPWRAWWRAWTAAWCCGS